MGFWFSHASLSSGLEARNAPVILKKRLVTRLESHYNVHCINIPGTKAVNSDVMGSQFAGHRTCHLQDRGLACVVRNPRFSLELLSGHNVNRLSNQAYRVRYGTRETSNEDNAPWYSEAPHLSTSGLTGEQNAIDVDFHNLDMESGRGIRMQRNRITFSKSSAG